MSRAWVVAAVLALSACNGRDAAPTAEGIRNGDPNMRIVSICRDDWELLRQASTGRFYLWRPHAWAADELLLMDTPAAATAVCS